MKIKHWAGYGCVQGLCLHRGKGYTVVRISGNHEQGLEPRYFDTRDWDRWLGKRFKVGPFDKVSTITAWDDCRNEDVMEVVFIKEA